MREVGLRETWEGEREPKEGVKDFGSVENFGRVWDFCSVESCGNLDMDFGFGGGW